MTKLRRKAFFDTTRARAGSTREGEVAQTWSTLSLALSASSSI